MVTVVVPVHNVESMLAECLESILGQTLAELEVIAVDDGSTDGSPAILREFAARDPRVRVLTQPNAGQGAARNRAVDLARGEFLTFCDSDDVVPSRAYAHMVGVLRRTGSDFCVGAVRRFTHAQRFPKSWRGVHDRDVLATTIDEFPAAMQDIIACNRMFRTDFWRERVPPFRAHIAYEDHVPMLAAYVRARRFDSLARVTYLWRSREDNTSTGQQKADLENLLDRIAVMEEARSLLLAEGSTTAYDAWVGRTIGVDYQPFIRYALGADDMYRNVLSAAFATMFGRSTADALDQVAFRSKVRGWLCAIGRWDALVEAERYLALHGKIPRTVPDGPRLRAEPDPRPAFLDLVPEHLQTLAVHESDLSAGLRRAAWQPDGGLVLTGYAFVRGLDGSRHRPTVRAWLHDEDSGAEVPLETRSLDDPWINTVGTQQADCSRCGLEIVVPAAAVVGVSRRTAWTVRLSVALGELVREGSIDDALDGSPATRLPDQQVEVDGGRLLLRAHLGERGLQVVAEPTDAPREAERDEAPRVVVEDVRLDDDVDSEVVVELDRQALRDGQVTGASLVGAGVEVDAVSIETTDDRVVLRIPGSVDRWRTGSRAALPLGRYRLAVTLRGADGADATVAATPAPPLLAELPLARLGSGLRVDVRHRRDGSLGLTVAPPLDPAHSTAYGQRRLQRAYVAAAAGQRPEPDSVLLVSAQGRQVGGNPLAIDRELRRTRPDLRRFWGVRSHATPVPEGSEPVVIGSPRWYDLLGTAGHLVVDDDLDQPFAKRPGQRVLQTFRGRPFRAFGRARWAHERLAPEQVALEVAQRGREWDAVLAPDEAAAAAYRRELDYDGDVLVTGTPRCDALVDADRSAARAGVLDQLGLAEDATVVLYAPTYRDSFSPRVRSAGLPRDLDLGRLARDLGPGVAVLLRAHPLDRRDAAALTQGTAVTDVTDHPDVTALLHAADVAVLDYSSLRFDWALTGRPAVCFTPDLERVTAVRPFLEEYADTAPGPCASSTDEVVALLQDLPGLARLAAPALARVNDRYNRGEDGHAAARAVAGFFPS